MVGITFDFRHRAVAHSRQESTANTTVRTVGFFPALDRAALIFVHDEILAGYGALSENFVFFG
jgi:hypothetical protein